MRCQFVFTPVEKQSLIRVCELHFLPGTQESLKVDGSTVLDPGDAIVLAGYALPYYHFLSDRLIHHPAVQDALFNGPHARQDQ